jgi:hypothetical protein
VAGRDVDAVSSVSQSAATLVLRRISKLRKEGGRQ